MTRVATILVAALCLAIGAWLRGLKPCPTFAFDPETGTHDPYTWRD